ncbi:MAG TPA: TonB-dependent receptor [Bacteroidales bacterium]|nr:TonB-dependent receptor [Bacteroidales bacterium]
MANILLLFLLLTGKSYTQGLDFDNATFGEFAERAEGIFKVRFFYDEAALKDLRITSRGCKTISCVLDVAFNGKALFYLIEESGNVIITSGYGIYVPGGSMARDSDFLVPGIYPGLNDSGEGAINISVEVGNPAEKNKPGNVLLSGYVRNTDTNEPVQGVTVYVRKLSAGTVTNQFGFYSLALPRGSHSVQFSFIGMRQKQVSLKLYGEGELNVDMKSVLVSLKETVVSAGKSMTMQRFETGSERISISSFRLLPTSMGESDIMKSMLMIPGVVSVGEGSAGFNVRGGSADQNLVLLYGAPVYNSSHFFGFFSSVNSDIIRDVTLYKGGIPGRYGGRISSVVDIIAREGNRKEFRGNAGISPVTAHISLEGPLIKDTLTYLLAARTTYSNWVFGLIDNPMIDNSRASFRDLNARIVFDRDKNNKIDVSFYSSHDDFRFRFDTAYSYNNSIAAIRWRHFYNPRFFSSFSLNNSFYSYDVRSSQRTAEAFTLSHTINTTGFVADFNWFKGKHEMNFGMDLSRHAVSPGAFSPLSDSSLVLRKRIQLERGWEGALYLEDRLVISDVLSIDIGLRLSSYLFTGPSSVLHYDGNPYESRATVSDTVKYSSGKIIKTYGGPEFRMAANFIIDDDKSVKINFNTTKQYLHLLSNSASISPTDTWKLSDYHIRPQTGAQVSAGFYKIFSGKTTEASAEIFYKSIRNMNDFKAGTSLIMNEDVEKDIINLKGRAYGLEFQLKKPEGKIRYTIGYAWSRTMVRSTSRLRNEKINSGKWFPANFDRPHDLTVMFSYIFSRRFNISSNYVLSTGRPITYPVALYNVDENVLLHYSERNGYRLPDYSRLDLSFRVNGSLRSKKLANPYWSFSVYNVLARRNIYSVFFREEGDVFKGYSLSVFGTAIPSLSFGFDF